MQIGWTGFQCWKEPATAPKSEAPILGRALANVLIGIFDIARLAVAAAPRTDDEPGDVAPVEDPPDLRAPGKQFSDLDLIKNGATEDVSACLRAPFEGSAVVLRDLFEPNGRRGAARPRGRHAKFRRVRRHWLFRRQTT